MTRLFQVQKMEREFDRNLVISAYLKEIECIYEKGVH